MVLLKNVITRPNIEVGDFTYYDDPEHATSFQDRNVLYHYEWDGDRLIIGKFCALGTGTTFIMNGANHRLDGLSTFPFPIMGGAWAEHMDLLGNLPSKGDTVIGHDVWTGYGTLIMPGVTIGAGAVIASGSVVVNDLPPYAIAGGNPAQIIKKRFDDATIDALLDIAWWDWPLERISTNVKALMAGQIADLT